MNARRYLSSSINYRGAEHVKAALSFRDPAASALRARRLLFLSDVHFSTWFPERGLRRMLAEIEALSPDMILWGGDYGENERAQYRFFELVRALRPPLGMVGVAGNNDLECFRYDYGALRAAMRSGGMTLLVNEEIRIPLDAQGAYVSVAGLDDGKRGRPRAAGFFAKDASAFRILLSHNPYVLWRILPAMNVRPDAALCGHTHGGQFALGPLNPFVLGFECVGLPRPVPVTGWTSVAGVPILISNGIGESRLPLRIGAPPQMHILELREGTRGEARHVFDRK